MRVPHESSKPIVRNGKVVRFPTKSLAEYPQEWCREYASCLGEALADAQEIRKGVTADSIGFLEVFSGEHALLIQCVIEAGLSQPQATALSDTEELGSERAKQWLPSKWAN